MSHTKSGCYQGAAAEAGAIAAQVVNKRASQGLINNIQCWSVYLLYDVSGDVNSPTLLLTFPLKFMF